ncbi:EF hand family protein, putative [Babesia ovis]|uniref:EF hand family protein, putative n=1 Tax=Babesia ovis TaxID=5869 RepID=A0A9W5WVF3_BABOV|nr:EF hand family protein, putative [Babesia ovis]
MDSELKFEQLCKEIYAYYGSNAVNVQGNRAALMLRATGEPWSKEEIEQYTQSRGTNITYEEFRRLARAKRFGTAANSHNPADYHHVVDDYGTWINLSVSECREIVDAFKAIVQLRGAVDNRSANSIPTQYLKHVITSVGDPLPRHIVKYLRMEQYGYSGTVSIRTLLRMLSRKEALQ